MAFGVIIGTAYIVSSTQATIRKEVCETLNKIFDKTDGGPNIDLVRSIIRSIAREKGLTVVTVNLLEDYLLYLAKWESTTDQIEKIKAVQQLIERELEEEPFDALPDEEKRLLRALTDSVELGDKDAANYTDDSFWDCGDCRELKANKPIEADALQPRTLNRGRLSAQSARLQSAAHRRRWA